MFCRNDERRPKPAGRGFDRDTFFFVSSNILLYIGAKEMSNAFFALFVCVHKKFTIEEKNKSEIYGNSKKNML